MPRRVLSTSTALSRKARALLAALAVGALAALLAGCGGGSAAELQPDDVAAVGSIHIPKARFDAQLQLARVSYKAQNREFPKAGTAEFESIKAQALALLVQAAARELKAESIGITVTDAEVQKRLAELKKQYFDGDEKKYRAELKRLGLTDAEVREQTRTQLISERVSERVTSEVEVTDEEIAGYYAANAAQYQREERDMLYILVGKGKKALAEEIHAKLENGAAFGQLAKRYSQDPSSKDNGGKLTAVKGQVVPKFEEVAFSLKPGELAEPFETPEYGWFVVKAVSPVRKVTTPLEEAREGIRQQLQQQKASLALTEWLTDAAKSVCSDGRIAYQVGYAPNPDPCAQFTATTPTETTG